MVCPVCTGIAVKTGAAAGAAALTTIAKWPCGGQRNVRQMPPRPKMKQTKPRAPASKS